jgi:hypothetical protein
VGKIGLAFNKSFPFNPNTSVSRDVFAFSGSVKKSDKHLICNCENDVGFIAVTKIRDSSVEICGRQAGKKRKCPYHPALICQSSEQPCVFAKEE